MDRVRIGILGASRVAPGAVIAPARDVREAEVVAIAARDPARAAEFAQKHDVPRTHPDYASLVADPDLDAVYNALPNGLHGVWAIAALEAGKHVLCEKPFTANAAEAESVAAAANAADRVVMEAFHYRYHPLFARVLERCAELGPLRELSSRMVAVLPNRQDIRYRLDLAGGATMDVGCYAIHQLRTIAGSEPTVTRASAKVIESGVDREMRAELRFGDGVPAKMRCALLAARTPVADIRVRGERGTVAAYFVTRPQMGWIRSRIARSTRRERVKGAPTFFYQLQAFCGAVLRGEPLLTPPSDAVANMQVIDAVYDASGLSRRQPSA